jgi:Raf kinase inhibitor-like YbhB/YbcL family protein
MALTLTSTAFSDGGLIPRRYTCDGEDVSPPLAWRDAPAGTRSFALICDDPDAPAKVWVHWVIYNLPATVTDLPEAVPPDPELPRGGRQGRNDFGRLGYGGPCPPSGTHRYFFRLYALDALLDLAPGATKGDLVRKMAGHILAETVLVGRYARQR